MDPVTQIVTALSVGAAFIAEKDGEELIRNGAKDLTEVRAEV